MIEMGEELRRFLLSLNPELHLHLKQAVSRDISDTLPSERVTVVMAILEKKDPSSPQVRRDVREKYISIVSSHDSDGEETSLVAKNIRSLKDGLDWLKSSSFLQEINDCSGPECAIKLTRKKLGFLNRDQSAFMLKTLGYPLVFPDTSKARWANRVGLLKNYPLQRNDHYFEAVRVFANLSREMDMHPLELDLLLGVFAGSRGQAIPKSSTVCGPSPQCQQCPIKKHCDYYSFVSQHGVDQTGKASNSLKHALSAEELPREKLINSGAEHLSDAELIGIILRTGGGGKSVLDLSRAILQEGNGKISGVEEMSLKELASIRGMGQVKAVTLQAAFELGKRLLRSAGDKSPSITGAQSVYNYLHAKMMRLKKEQFIALLLDTKNRVFREIKVSEGTLNQSLVHPREAFRDAIKDSASAVIFVHNHPSGDSTPSRADHTITRRLIEAGDVIGIRVLDHVIIGHHEYYSFADEGTLK